MLIAKIYIKSNKIVYADSEHVLRKKSEQIDEIHIQNIGLNEIDDNFHNYAIRKPDNIDKIIVHNRKDGYKPLLASVLDEIDINKRKNHGTKIKQSNV